MKERGPNELTNQPNSFNLEGKGNNMPDGGTNGGPEQSQPAAPNTEQERIARDLARVEADQAEMLHRGKEFYDALKPLAQAKVNKRVSDVFGNLDPVLQTQARYQFAEAALSDGEKDKIGVPESLVDLTKLIIKASDPAVWGEGGTKALISTDKETGRQTVNTANFLDWTRTNMFKVHNMNPTSNINFFNDLGMSVRNDVYGSMISFYEIVFQESLFLDVKNVNGVEVKEENDDYKELRNQLLNEVFLFSLMRNGDIAYNLGRGEQKEMMNALAQAFAVNPLTRSNFFEFIMTMPSMQRQSIRDLEAGKDGVMRAKTEGNFYMGDAVRQALSAYMNIFDYEQLTKILGKDAALFKWEYEVWDPETGEKKKDKTTGQLVDNKKISPDVEKNPVDRTTWYYTQEDVEALAKKGHSVKIGDVKLWSKKNGKNIALDPVNGTPDEKFMDYVNIFLSPNPDQRQQEEIRERIVLSIMKSKNISYNEAKLAEVWAYSMTHMNGIAARNDTQSVAFDWWTRLTNFRDYRKRQKAEKRGANYGGNYNMEGFKRIGLTFFEAARDVRGRTIQEIIQGGQGRDIDIEANPLKKVVDVERDDNGLIIFYDKEGQKIQGQQVKHYDVIEEIDRENGRRKSRVIYLDEQRKEVNVGQAHAKTVIKDVDAPVQFKADLQKQFLPNHMYTAAGVYEHVIKQVQMNFPEMLKGWDTQGYPILDQEKVDKIKAEIEHDIRYSLSTWQEINYSDKYLMWERKEVRNENGRLVSKNVKDSNGNPMELDEDWNIIGTKERDEPETYLDRKEMTILESMFGTDALKYIQFEIEKRKLTYNDLSESEKEKLAKEGKGAHVEKITGRGFGGKEETVNVDLTQHDKEQFRIAVWRGAFDYLVASEIAAHRDRGSGFKWYDSSDMIKVVDVLRGGEFVTPDQIGKIQVSTRTKLKWLFTKDLGYVFATGGLEGFWKILQIMFKESLSGV